MSSLFKDDYYDNMEWIEKACLPVVCLASELLQQLPDVIQLTYDDLFIEDTQPTLNEVLNRSLGRFNEDYLKKLNELDYETRKDIYFCFAFEIKGGSVKVNMKTKTLTGDINLIKTKKSFDEKETQNRLFRYALNNVHAFSHLRTKIERVNELAEILGVEFSSRGKRDRMNKIQEEIRSIFKDNKWKIMNVQLSNSIYNWIYDYLLHGRMNGLVNLCKVKIMTHSGEPIYSVEIEE